MEKLRKQRALWSSLLGFCLAGTVHAQGNWFVNGSAGATFPNVSHNDYISSGVGWPNDRYKNNGVNTAPLFALEGGYQWSHNRLWLPFYSLAARYSYVFPAKVKGNVYQYSLPEFENYSYQYKIQWQTFMATMKADLFRFHQFMPFLLLGAGVSLNNASNYSETAVPSVTPRESPGFKGSTNTYFSYALGVGVDYIVQKNVWVNLRYEYGHQGYAQTGPGANTSTLTDTNYSTDKLKTKLFTNSVLLGVTYFLDPVA